MRTLTEKDFWNSIDINAQDDCWEWQKQRDAKGYGRLNSKLVPTHIASRAAYILTYGEIPNGLLVCHKCDNPPCCNPNHLFLGTERDNVDDSVSKGRRLKVAPDYKSRYWREWYNRNRDKRLAYMRKYRAND